MLCYGIVCMDTGMYVYIYIYTSCAYTNDMCAHAQSDR